MRARCWVSLTDQENDCRRSGWREQSVPRSRVVETLGQGLSSSALGLDLLGVMVEWARSVGDIDLGPVSRHWRPGTHQPDLDEAQVGTRARLVVLHDAGGGEEVVDHVRGEGDRECKEQAHLGDASSRTAHLESLVGHVDGFLELAHVLRWGHLAALR